MWKEIFKAGDFKIGDTIRQLYSIESDGRKNYSQQHIITEIKNGFVYMENNKQSSITAMTSGEFNYEVFIKIE
jgi:hypothetical protein